MRIPVAQEFGTALCRHFKLSPEQIQGELVVRADEEGTLTVSMTLALTTADLSAIANHMREARH